MGGRDETAAKEIGERATKDIAIKEKRMFIRSYLDFRSNQSVQVNDIASIVEKYWTEARVSLGVANKRESGERVIPLMSD